MSKVKWHHILIAIVVIAVAYYAYQHWMKAKKSSTSSAL